MSEIKHTPRAAVDVLFNPPKLPPPRTPHDLTSSEVALAKVLAVLVDHDKKSAPGDAAARTLERLKNEAYTDANRALLERARKAGVL